MSAIRPAWTRWRQLLHLAWRRLRWKCRWSCWHGTWPTQCCICVTEMTLYTLSLVLFGSLIGMMNKHFGGKGRLVSWQSFLLQVFLFSTIFLEMHGLGFSFFWFLGQDPLVFGWIGWGKSCLFKSCVLCVYWSPSVRAPIRVVHFHLAMPYESVGGYYTRI